MGIGVSRFPPWGVFIRTIEESKILKKDLAKALGILPNDLSLLFAGNRNISAQLALGTSAEYWYGMQTAYDLQKLGWKNNLLTYVILLK